MSHLTPRRTTSSLVKIGNDDPTLTGHAGLLLTGELTRRLHVIETIDEAVNRVRRFKQRQRGLSRIAQQREGLAGGEDRDDRHGGSQHDAADRQHQQQDRDQDDGAGSAVAHPFPA